MAQTGSQPTTGQAATADPAAVRRAVWAGLIGTALEQCDLRCSTPATTS